MCLCNCIIIIKSIDVPLQRYPFKVMRLRMRLLYKWTNRCDCLPVSFTHENRPVSTGLRRGRYSIGTKSLPEHYYL